MHKKNKNTKSAIANKSRARKKTLLYLFLIVLGNALCLSNMHAQDEMRYVAGTGFVIMLYSIYMFGFAVAELVTGTTYNYGVIKASRGKVVKAIHKPSYVFIAVVVSLGLIHFVAYNKIFAHEDALLERDGIEVITTVLERDWVKPRKKSGYYRITYEYEYQGRTYRAKREEKILQVGDTIIVKFLPENPHNNSHRAK